MRNILVNKEKFKFTYLPEYADYLLKNKLNEFVLVGIRFCREENLPLFKPLNKLSEQDLVNISLDSNREMLEALAVNKIADVIVKKTQKWISNTLGVIDKDDIVAEDLTLGFFLRRKIFGYFLDGYTKNVVEQKFIIAELDRYTTQEELIFYAIYLRMQQEKLSKMNTELDFHKKLLLEAQELVETGSFLINFKDQSKSIFTPEYQKILEIDSLTPFDKFMACVHPADRKSLTEKINTAYKQGGMYEMEYRYKKNREKRIWSKGFIISEEGKPILIRGVVKEVA